MWGKLALGAVLMLALAAPAAAQGLTAASFAGQWKSSSTNQGTRIDTTLTITGETYISTQEMVTEGIFGPVHYAATQEGKVEFTRPDTLRLVVEKWSPDKTGTEPNPKPPNTNWRVLQFDDSNLLVLDNVCAPAAGVRACSTAFRKAP